MTKQTDADVLRTLAGMQSLPNPDHFGTVLERVAAQLDRDASDYKKSEALQEIGRRCFEGIAKMVAALECDYDRLEELRDMDPAEFAADPDLQEEARELYKARERYDAAAESIHTATAPSAWASYLINGDDSGISAEDKAAADAWIKSVGLGDPVSCEDAGFRWRHDAYAFMPLGADCQEYSFLSDGEL